MTSGTTARAAEVLRISQPAVSKAVAELERTIGFELFHRVKGRLQLTAEGQLLFRKVELTFAGLAHLRGAAARIRDYGAGELRIACLSALSTPLMPRVLARFLARHPQVAVTYQVRMSSEVRDLVASGQLDMGLVADEIDKTGVKVRPFAGHRAALALPEGHPLAGHPVIRPQDLGGVAFVALAPDDTTRQEAERAFATVGSRHPIVLKTPYATTICALVAAGIGVGLVDPLTADPYLDRGLVLRPCEPRLPFRTLQVLPPALAHLAGFHGRTGGGS